MQEKVIQVKIECLREKECNSKEEVLEYLKNNWDETELLHIWVRPFHFKNVITEGGFGLNRGVNNGRRE